MREDQEKDNRRKDYPAHPPAVPGSDSGRAQGGVAGEARRGERGTKNEGLVNGKSIIDGVPDLIWSLVGGASGFIAAHGFSRDSTDLILATHFRRAVAIAVALSLGTVFALTRRRFPAIGNVSLWFATFCVGFIYR
jgi:hypothetical protein